MYLYVLDLLGVFAFAAFGTHRALQVKMDVLGLFVCAAMTALGGGTVRAVVLGQTPSFFEDYNYIAVVVAGLLFAVILNHGFARLNPYLQVLDGIGLATFALVGASRAAAAGWGLGPMTLCALLTAAGGGVICDLLTGRRPQIFYGEFYAAPACAMGLLAWLARDHLADSHICLLLLAAVFTMHMLGVLCKWTVWRPHQTNPAADREEDTVRLSRAELNLPKQHLPRRGSGPGIRHSRTYPTRQSPATPPPARPGRDHRVHGSGPSWPR